MYKVNLNYVYVCMLIPGVVDPLNFKKPVKYCHISAIFSAMSTYKAHSPSIPPNQFIVDSGSGNV